jgi:hypothetical protein
MDLAQFWKIVDVSREKADGDVNAQIETLAEEVRKLPVEEVISFGDHFHDRWYEANLKKLWAAAYLLSGGCSDDGFMDFRGRLIARGQKVFEAALKDPDSLAEVVEEDEECQIEGFQYIAALAWAEKTGQDMGDFPGKIREGSKGPLGEDWEDDDLQGMFPKLWEKFGDNI